MRNRAAPDSARPDRIAVIYEGKIVGMVDPAEATREQIGLMMAGAGAGL